MPFGIQPLHIVLVVIVALIIFGPEKLPQIGRELGRTISQFRTSMRDVTEGFREETGTTASPAAQTVVVEPKILPPPAQPPIACPNCNTLNPESSKFCSNCGAKLIKVPDIIVCPNCNMANKGDAKFCNNCGTNLQSNLAPVTPAGVATQPTITTNPVTTVQPTPPVVAEAPIQPDVMAAAEPPAAGTTQPGTTATDKVGDVMATEEQVVATIVAPAVVDAPAAVEATVTAPPVVDTPAVEAAASSYTSSAAG